MQNQMGLDRTTVDQRQTELEDHVETSQRLVHSFLQEELQHDVPTGETLFATVPLVSRVQSPTRPVGLRYDAAAPPVRVSQTAGQVTESLRAAGQSKDGAAGRHGGGGGRGRGHRRGQTQPGGPRRLNLLDLSFIYLVNFRLKLTVFAGFSGGRVEQRECVHRAVFHGREPGLQREQTSSLLQGELQKDFRVKLMSLFL